MADGVVVAVCREGDRWRVDLLPPALLGDLDRCLAAVAQLPSDASQIALLNVEDEFFIAVRLTPRAGVRLLLSDATAALEWDLARQVLERLAEEVPAEDDDQIWPAGDLDLFADLGLPGDELRMVVDDIELYADEMLGRLADRLGFGAQYAAVVDVPPRQ